MVAQQHPKNTSYYTLAIGMIFTFPVYFNLKYKWHFILPYWNSPKAEFDRESAMS